MRLTLQNFEGLVFSDCLERNVTAILQATLHIFNWHLKVGTQYEHGRTCNTCKLQQLSHEHKLTECWLAEKELLLLLIGTTWVRELLWKIYNDGAISDVHLGSRVFWLEAHSLLRKRQSERPESSPDSKPVIDLLPSPRLLVSHLPYDVIPKGKDDSTTCNYIYIARNPKDVAVSFYHFLLSFESDSGLTCDILGKLFLQGKREC